MHELNSSDEKFDIVFLDASKDQYTSYYKIALDMLTPSGFIMADNSLCALLYDEDDSRRQALHDFNQMIKNDKRVEQLVVPFREGVSIIRPKKYLWKRHYLIIFCIFNFFEGQGIINSIKLVNCDYHLLLSRHFAKPCLTVINLPLITLSSTVDSRELESSREIEKSSSYLACSRRSDSRVRREGDSETTPSLFMLFFFCSHLLRLSPRSERLEQAMNYRELEASNRE